MWNAIRRTVYAIIAIFNVSAVLVLLWLFMAGHFTRRQPSTLDLLLGSSAAAGAGSGVDYKDFISILLTALGLMIAILAAAMALAAIWGFNVLKEASQVAARGHAKEVAEKEARITSEQVATRLMREFLSQQPPVTRSDYGEAGGLDVERKD